MRFPPSFLERIRSHFLMSEVVGKRIPIKKHGREFQGLCPFHNEKSPSFTVNDEKNFFHCFGCGAHGDSIEFIKRYERLTYPEAIEALAREAGIPLPVVSAAESQKIEQQKTLYDVCEAAAVWFEKQLQEPSGAVAADYVSRRGLLPETLRAFRVGYAPEDRNALHQHLTKLGFPAALQAEAGLIIQPDSGGAAYDRFRGRVMFPIRSASGKVVAFGGRLLAANAAKNLPKYLNSPETPLFKKGELLFNLDLAKRPAREGNLAVVMEGYMDVVSSAQAGVGYAVATLGTAVSAEHLRLLWQLAKEPVMCLDGDTAGMRAMMRTAEVALPLLQPGFSLRFAILPKGEDPDSFVQKHGKAAFERLLITSRRLSQLLWETLSPQFDLSLPEGRAALEAALTQMTDKIVSPSVRQHYSAHFRRQIWAQASSAAASAKPAAQAKQGQPASKQKQPANTRSAHVEQMVLHTYSAALETLARRMLKTVLMFPALLHKSQVEEKLHRMEIQSSSLGSLRDVLLNSITQSNIDDREVFDAYVHSKLPAELLQSLLNDSLNLPFSNSLTEEDAMLLWSESASAYRLALLQTELQELQRSLGQSMDEAAYHRMIEVQTALKQANAERSFSRATDVA
ncbi:MAG: DNA primase [Alphaproteobacteria bacterium]|nr:DNA primase [Alphaproteobacteria bacterium]